MQLTDDGVYVLHRLCPEGMETEAKEPSYQCPEHQRQHGGAAKHAHQMASNTRAHLPHHNASTCTTHFLPPSLPPLPLRIYSCAEPDRTIRTRWWQRATITLAVLLPRRSVSARSVLNREQSVASSIHSPRIVAPAWIQGRFYFTLVSCIASYSIVSLS